jgi:hypothetical protein
VRGCCTASFASTFELEGIHSTRKKIDRAAPVACAAEKGKIVLVSGET